ncbi:MAG: DUF1761 domain-containing protein [Acidimicrobiia bacterium]
MRIWKEGTDDLRYVWESELARHPGGGGGLVRVQCGLVLDPTTEQRLAASGQGRRRRRRPFIGKILVPTFIGYFVTTIVIALLVEAIGASDVADGLALGVALGVGFGVVGAMVGQLYEQKGSSYWLINGINAVIAYSIVAVILAVWN